VITGSLTAAHLVEQPSEWRADFGDLGEVSITFS
jgi:2-keto-4-pentenoate hydratase